jgi:hypothetical protein
VESERLIEGGLTRAGEAKHETVTLDGVDYDFVLIDRGGEFVGSWRCPTCSRGDASPLRYSDPATIRLWARHSLEVHHLLFHDKSRQ